jgi:ferredoxin
VKIEIDYDKCIGIGSCESIAPDIFEVGDDGQVKVKIDDPDASYEATLREAEASCPTGAITVT